MKITKVPKRLAEALPQVQDLLRQCLEAADDELPDILDGIIDWCWPRGDLHYWVPVLNRFDIILEETCRDYDLQKLQINDFTPMRKRIVTSVLHFTRLLIENSTSRKLYNSYEHLNNLLMARDVDILEATLRVLLRFAQQQSSQPRPELTAAQQRLASLAVAWPPRDLGISNVDLAKHDVVLPASLKHVRFQVYNASSRGEGSSGDAADTSLAGAADAANISTPTRARLHDRATSQSALLATPAHGNAPQPANHGASTVDLGRLDSSSKCAMDVLADAIEAHNVPREDHLELLQRIRLAMCADKPEQRHQLLVCRLLALGCYAHVTQESLATVQLFLFEPDVVQSVSDLVKPEHQLDQSVVSAALHALDALGRYRSKLSEVLSSLSASVNHGVLMQVLRNIIDDLASGHPKNTDLIIDAFYGLASFITSTSSGSSLIVGAGLVQLLVELLERAKPEEYIVQRTMARTLGLLDSLVYAYPPAFELFCQARGLDVLVKRIEEQVATDIETASTDMQEEGQAGPDAPYGLLTFGKAHLMRGFLQSILHMMASTGTADGLRNLIDTSLVISIKTMMEHRRVFGPQNLALAINIMATFVHNEPTTLGVIQEKKLPETFLKLIKDDIEAHFDVISAIPNAVGALCLNQAGLDMFSAEPIIANLLSLITSERHIKVLTDQDNIAVFGGAVDELIRHQPTMRQVLMDELLKVLQSVKTMGNDFHGTNANDASTYELSEVSPDSLSQYETSKDKLKIAPADLLADEVDIKKHSRAKLANNVATVMDTLCRFLETLFQSTSLCKDFLKTDGLDSLLQFYDLPCLPFDFGTSPAADSLVHFLQFIAEMSPNTVIHAVLRQVKASLTESQHIWSDQATADKLLQLVTPSSEAMTERNADYRKLVKLSARIQLFADITSALYFTHSKTMLAFLQVFNAEQPAPASGREYATLQDLAKFQQDWCWQTILFKANAPMLPAEDKDGKEGQVNAVQQAPTESGSADAQQPVASTSGATGSESKANTNDAATDSKALEPIMRNVVALRCIVGQVREAMSSLFSDSVRLLNAKRVTDTAHKRAASSTAMQIGTALASYMKWRPHSNAAFSCAFAECATREATKIMYEDRNGRLGNVQASVLIPFVRNGGLSSLIANFESITRDVGEFFDEDGKPLESADLDTTVHMSITCSSMRACLKLFHQLVSSKTLLESSTTQAATTKDEKQRGSNDYFNPHESLIFWRSVILKVVQHVWEQRWLREMPISTLRLIIQILVRICEATGEEAIKKESPVRSLTSGNNPSSGLGPFAVTANGTGISAALAGLSGTLNALGSGARPPTQPPNQDRVNQLIDMGFSRRAASHALTRNLNNVSAAAEYLLTHPAVVQGMTDEEPEAEAEPEQGAEGAARDASAAVAAPTGETAEPAADAVEGAQADAGTAAPEAEAAEASATGNATQEAAGADVDMTEGASAATAEAEKQQIATAEQHDKEAAETLKELSDLRMTVIETLVPRALMLADRYESLIYDVKAALFVASDSFRKSELLVGLIKQIEDYAAVTGTEAEQTIANRLHLLALTFNDTVVTVELSAERAKQLMTAVRKLLDAHPVAQGDSRTPKWTASLLLVLAAILRADHHVPSIDLPEKDAPAQSEQDCTVPTTNLFEDDMPVLLQYTIARLQHLQGLTADDLLAFYRFIVLVTRKASIAREFSESDGVALLLKPFAEIDARTIEGCRPHALLVMRNVVESSPAILKGIMRSSLVQWFKQQRSKTIDTTSISRGMANAMLRDPDVFMQVAREELSMIDYSVTKAQGFVKMIEPSAEQSKSAEIKSGNATGGQALEGVDLQEAVKDEAKTETGKPKAASEGEAHREVDTLVSFLSSDIQRGVRELFYADCVDTSGEKMDLDKDKTSEEIQKVKERRFLYVSFLLQSLAELLSSYASCKTAFLQSTLKKRSNANPPQNVRKGDTPFKGKQTSSMLSTFLGEIVPLGFVAERPQEEMRRAMSVSNWAMSTIVALCTDVASQEQNNEVSASVRKSVAESLIKCFKDATGAGMGRVWKEPIDARYGRLYALSDLCYRLFTANPNRSTTSAAFDDSIVQFVKILLERNFVSVLTGAIADIDLNIATAKTLVEKILKPLEHLTKIANMMNKAERKGDKLKAKHRATSEPSEEDASVGSSDEEMAEGGANGDNPDAELREETPDFYRNSSLGMHTGDLEGGAVEFDEDDEEDDDEDDDMDDDMQSGMGYDDEMTDDSDSDDSDIEEHIVEIMDDGVESDSDESDSDPSESSDEDDVEEGSWVDEDEEEDDLVDAGDGEALDLVLEGGDDEAREIFNGGEGPLFPGDEGMYDGDGMPRPLLVDGDMDEDEEGEDMEEDEGESMLEDAFEDGLGSMGLTLPGDPGHVGGVDRFGASWGWASGGNHAARHGNEAGTSGSDESVSPFAFLSQRPISNRQQRNLRRLMDWDDTLRAGRPRPVSSGPLISGINADHGGLGNRDVASHPLLVSDNVPADANGGAVSTRVSRSHVGRRNNDGAPDGRENWARSIEELMSGGAMQVLETLLTRGGMGDLSNGGAAQPISISIGSQNGMPQVTVAGAVPGTDGVVELPHRHETSPSGRYDAPAQSQQREMDVVSLVQDFQTQRTLTRWGEAMRILHGPLVDVRLMNLRNYLIMALRPSLLARQEETKKKRAELEQERRKNNEDLEKAKRAKERVEEELQQARAQYDEFLRTQQQHEQQEAPAQAAETTHDDAQAAEDTVMQDEVPAGDQPAAAAAAAVRQANLELGSLQQGLDELDSSARSNAASATGHRDAEEEPATSEEVAASTAIPQEPPVPPQERVTTTINGAVVDITDSGIDPTFLEALPEDMREEVLNQHFRERRAAQAASRASSAIEASSIAPEFLNALPPEIRAEVIQQEAIEQQRRRAEENRRRGNADGESEAAQPRDMDPTDFLATLNPELRSAILSEGDQSFLDTLPVGLHEDIDAARRSAAARRAAAAAGDTAREQQRAAPEQTGQSSAAAALGGQADAAAEGKKKSSRNAIQLLDKFGVAALTRLMFLPQLDVQQSGLRNVLGNLSENAKTRSELLNYLLLLLAENTGGDGSSPDRGIAAITQRASKAAPSPARPVPKRSATAGTSTLFNDASANQRNGASVVTPLSRRTGDDAPFLVALRSIDMLLHLTTTNEQAANHFLRDDACSGALMKWFARNTGTLSSKGKERSASAGASIAPVNVLLVLLSKPTILENAQLVDGLIALLNTVTRPLPTIAANVEKASAEKVKDEHVSGADKDASAPTNLSADPSTPSRPPPAMTEAINAKADEKESESGLPLVMPHIVDERLASVVKPLSTGISSKGFQHTLAVASHLATIDGARDVITDALHREATMASQNLMGELDALLESLPEPPAPTLNEDDEQHEGQSEQPNGHAPQVNGTGVDRAATAVPSTRINSPALTELASPSSSQTVILRSLRALEWVMTRPSKGAAPSAATTAPSMHTHAHNHTHAHAHGGNHLQGFGIPGLLGRPRYGGVQ